jgi:hypothetical protein
MTTMFCLHCPGSARSAGRPLLGRRRAVLLIVTPKCERDHTRVEWHAGAHGNTVRSINWQPFPSFPPSARLVGHPAEPGPYVIRVKVPVGVKLMPHKHPEDRIYTVISGVFYIGLGKSVRRRQAEGASARQRHRPAGRYTPLPLGQVRRVCHSGQGDRAVGARVPRSRR